MASQKKQPEAVTAHALKEMESCISCSEQISSNDCPKSERHCGHHCNHTWDDKACCWCGAEEFDEIS